MHSFFFNSLKQHFEQKAEQKKKRFVKDYIRACMIFAPHFHQASNNEDNIKV